MDRVVDQRFQQEYNHGLIVMNLNARAGEVLGTEIAK